MATLDSEVRKKIRQIKAQDWPATLSKAAQVHLDWLDTKIGNIKNESLHNQVIRAMRKLCQQSGCLPTNMCLPLEVTSPPNAEHISASALSDVYRKQWGEHLVALKMLRIHVEHQEAVRKAFIHEAAIWRCLKHPHIATFLGIAAGHPACLVSQWMKNGTITMYLKANPQTNPLRLIKHIISGLQYLHSIELVHGDMKAANVLVNDNGEACLTDFGLTIVLYHSNTFTSTYTSGGTLRYMAPELLEEKDGFFGMPSEKSDIYAVAMVVWEIFSGRHPFDDVRLPHEFGLVKKIVDGARPERPEGQMAEWLTDDVWDWVLQAWQSEPQHRPPLADLAQAVEQGVTQDSGPLGEHAQANTSGSSPTPQLYRRATLRSQEEGREDISVPIPASRQVRGAKQLSSLSEPRIPAAPEGNHGASQDSANDLRRAANDPPANISRTPSSAPSMHTKTRHAVAKTRSTASPPVNLVSPVPDDGPKSKGTLTTTPYVPSKSQVTVTPLVDDPARNQGPLHWSQVQQPEVHTHEASHVPSSPGPHVENGVRAAEPSPSERGLSRSSGERERRLHKLDVASSSAPSTNPRHTVQPTYPEPLNPSLSHSSQNGGNRAPKLQTARSTTPASPLTTRTETFKRSASLRRMPSARPDPSAPTVEHELPPLPSRYSGPNSSRDILAPHAYATRSNPSDMHADASKTGAPEAAQYEPAPTIARTATNALLSAPSNMSREQHVSSDGRPSRPPSSLGARQIALQMDQEGKKGCCGCVVQ